MTDSPTQPTRQGRRQLTRQQQDMLAKLSPSSQAALGMVMRDRIALQAASLIFDEILATNVLAMTPDLRAKVARFLGEHPAHKRV
jgi:hypothetical protein